MIYAVVAAGSGRAAFLRALTSATGGSLLEVRSMDGLGDAFLEILNEFRHRYLLTYTPRGVTPSGWHRVDVRVPGRRVTVRSRPGYLAASH